MCGHETRTISDTLPRAPGGGRVGPVREVLGGTPAGARAAHSEPTAPHTPTQTASAPAQTCAMLTGTEKGPRHSHLHATAGTDTQYAEESWRDWH